MTMSKQHFVALAKALRSERPCSLAEYPYKPELVKGAYDEWGTVSLAIMDVCKQFNPAFDREKFAAAVGMGE
jgi:hypothetical protein